MRTTHSNCHRLAWALLDSGWKPRTSWRQCRSLAIWLVAMVAPLAAYAQQEVKVPVQLKPVEDMVLYADDATLVVNLVGVFGNRPTDCVAESSDGNVVEVSLNRFDLMVTPVGVGEATITITASNSAGSVTIPVGATVVDRPPEAVGELPDATVTVGQAVAVDVAAGFSGSNLVYSVASSAPEFATAAVSGTTVTLTAHAAGEATVTVTAENGEGSASQPLSVTVKDQPPSVVGTLADTTMTVGEMLTVDVSAAFGGTALVYSVSSSAPEMAAAAVSGAVVTLTALAAGEATITVTAENSEGSASQPLALTVKDQLPVAAGTLDDVALAVGDTRDLDISAAFSGTALAYSVASSAPEFATAAVSGTTVTLTAHAAGEATVTVTAENGEGSASQPLSVTVKDQPPSVVGTLADTTMTVGEMLTVDVSAAFGGTALVYSVSSSAPEMAAAAVSGAVVTLTALAAGEATITVTAENSEGSASQPLALTVKDQLPVAAGTLDDVALAVGDTRDLDISAAFSGTALAYSVASSAPEFATAAVSGTTVTLTAHAAGEATVTVTAENGEGSASQPLSVTVKDQPPSVVGTLADTTMTVGEMLTVDVSAAFGGTALVYSVSSSAPEMAAAAVSGAVVTLTALAAGEATITVTAENSEGSASQPLALTVKDQLPVAAGTLDDVALAVGDTRDLDISAAFSGTALAYSVASSAPEFATAAVSGTTVTLTAHAAGEATVTVTAENGEGSASQPLSVTVKDQPPSVVGTLADTTMTVGEMLTVDVSAAFGGTALVYSVSSSAPEMAAAAVSGAVVTLTALAAGEATITVTAENSEGSASQPLALTVKDQLPVAVGTLDGVTLKVDDVLGVGIAEAFGGSALVYSVTSSAPEMATATISDATVNLTALAAGETMVTVTAENTEGSAMQTFTVVVEDVLPATVGTLSDATLTVGDTMDVEVAAAFSGSALVFSASSSAESLATATLTGTTVVVSALAAGQVTVTVTAENTAGSAMQMFMVTVEDQLPTTTGSLPNVALTTGGESANVDAAGSFNGSALVYTVAVSGDAVSASVTGAMVTVAPLVEGQATVTVTASNTAGAASLSFRATVSTDAAEASALAKGFAAIGASTLSSVSSAIGARFRNAGSGMAAPSMANAMQIGGTPWRAQPDRAAYDPLGTWGGGPGWQAWMPGGNSLNAAGSQDVKWQQPARWTVWGHADRQSFEGMGYDGGLTSVYVGADADFGERWLAGFAVSRSAGEADYEFTSGRARGTGDIETDMLSIFPYVRWSLNDDAEAWGILGFGWGDADHGRSATAQRGTADVSMWMASFGGRRTLASADAWELSLLGDASVLDLQTDGGVGIINDMEAGVSRLRAGLEAGRNIALEGGGLLTWFGQVAARHDGGDGETGAGAELTGGFRYDSSGRFGLEAKARMLAMHAADDYEESGLSVSAFVQPGPDGEGLSFSLSSHAGAGMGVAGESLIHGYGQPGVDAWRGRDAWAVDARLGYTVLDHRLSGLLTPFAEVDVADHGGHTMLGIAVDFSGRRALDRLNVELAGGRGHHELRGAAGGVFALRGELRF